MLLLPCKVIHDLNVKLFLKLNYSNVNIKRSHPFLNVFKIKIIEEKNYFRQIYEKHLSYDKLYKIKLRCNVAGSKKVFSAT